MNKIEKHTWLTEQMIVSPWKICVEVRGIQLPLHTLQSFEFTYWCLMATILFLTEWADFVGNIYAKTHVSKKLSTRVLVKDYPDLLGIVYHTIGHEKCLFKCQNKKFNFSDFKTALFLLGRVWPQHFSVVDYRLHFSSRPPECSVERTTLQLLHKESTQKITNLILFIQVRN